MPFPDDEIQEIKICFPKIALAEEGGIAYLILRDCAMPEGCEPRATDALLCPTGREGYSSRLFFAQKINHKGKGQNWNPPGGVVILDRLWWAVSWKIAPSNQRLLSKVVAHLEAFKQ